MKRNFTRRQFLTTTAKLGAASALASALPLPALRPWLAAAAGGFLTSAERVTLDAALGRMIPADNANDWSAASVGAGDYIDRLLSLDLDSDPSGIFAGGPYRNPDPPDTTTGFADFPTLSRVKREGWKKEIARLRDVYRAGLQKLNDLAGGNFAALPAEAEDAILTALDLASTPGDFFAALYAHTMEGVYGHPVYGGNKDFQAWEDLCYQGDVHGVRYPDAKDSDGNAWNVFGGYSPQEMIQPGQCPGQGPVKS